MTRREFFATTAAVAASAYFPRWPTPAPPVLPVIAPQTVEPLYHPLQWNTVGRMLLGADELPKGALSRYERDVACISAVLNSHRTVEEVLECV